MTVAGWCVVVVLRRCGDDGLELIDDPGDVDGVAGQLDGVGLGRGVGDGPAEQDDSVAEHVDFDPRTLQRLVPVDARIDAGMNAHPRDVGPDHLEPLADRLGHILRTAENPAADAVELLSDLLGHPRLLCHADAGAEAQAQDGQTHDPRQQRVWNASVQLPRQPSDSTYPQGRRRRARRAQQRRPQRRASRIEGLSQPAPREARHEPPASSGRTLFGTGNRVKPGCFATSTTAEAVAGGVGRGAGCPTSLSQTSLLNLRAVDARFRGMTARKPASGSVIGAGIGFGMQVVKRQVRACAGLPGQVPGAGRSGRAIAPAPILLETLARSCQRTALTWFARGHRRTRCPALRPRMARTSH